MSLFVILMNSSGQANILYTRRNFKEALRLFQDALRYNPNCQPDPRIGIGLCLWAMDDKVKARAAWQRSLEVASVIYPFFPTTAEGCSRILQGGPRSYFSVLRLSTLARMPTCPRPTERRLSSRERSS